MSNKIALITGGSSGIGLATARRLVADGFTVALAARNAERLHDAIDAIGDHAHRFVCDVADPHVVERLIGEVAGRFGRIDVLANVAGYAVTRSIAETTLDDWRTTMDVNATAVYAATHACWPIFARQGSGFVVNISSMASRDPFPGFYAYAAAKAAVNLLTLTTAREGAAIGVQAVCIAPSAVETPMLRGLFGHDDVPPDATLDPDEVAALIGDCIAGRRAFEPGETIYIQK